MNRREALQRAAWLMGGTLSAPLLLAAANGATADTSPTWKPTVLTQPQVDLVAAVVDIMIPRTDTPGAKDVGVPALIDLLLKDVYSPTDRARYIAGLTEFDGAAKQTYGKPFVALEPLKQNALVHKFHDDAVAAERRLNAREDAPVQRPFILATKEIALVGFFASFEGATRVLQYDAIPGAWHACIPLSEAGNGKTWATEPGIRL